jgi:[ribosomal protein S5]-alanine N-acetyltransferase
MQEFPHLQTSRLLLREITEEDADDLLRIHGDHQHMAWFGTDPLTSLTEAKKVIATFASWRSLPNPGTRWGLQLKERPGLIGSCGLFAWNRGWKKCTLGYELAPEATGRGLMREALSATLEWGFKNMELNRVEAQVHERNTPSLALLHSFGFVQEGRLREVAYWANHHHDLLQYSLLSREWQGESSAA